MKRCVLCGNTSFKSLYTAKRQGKAIPISQCKKCSLVIQHPFPRDIKGLYKEEYFKGEGFDPTVNYVKQLSSEQRKKFNGVRLDYLEKKSSGKRLLDVGCAAGLFLSTAKEKGWDTYGVEISSFAAKIAKKSIGAKKIHCGTLESCKFKKNFFDCITLFDVIEHVEDPVKLIGLCRSFLRKNGILVIETGNVDSLVAKLRGEKWGYFHVGHLVYFSRKTLRASYKKHKFSSVKILCGDEIPVWKKMLWRTGVVDRLREGAIATVRKIGVGNFSVGGMVAIGRK